MGMGMIRASRFDVFLVFLDPSHGHEIKKTRPCVIVSPDELNKNLKTVIIAPMTRTARDFPARIKTIFDGKPGNIILEQIRTIDKTRLIKKLGALDPKTSSRILNTLQAMFSA
jgi:mRNA interferase MazF